MSVWPSPRLAELADAVAPQLTGSDPAHDWQHVSRVAASARVIAEAEGADVTIVLAAALCHELVNLPKHHPDSAQSGARCADEARRLLARLGWPTDVGEAVVACIAVHGFSAGLSAPTLEAQVLQDADRLDAIGAIGIARCFATCSTMQRPFYAVDDPFCGDREPDDTVWGVDHFYRKLLRIPDRLNTATARSLAVPRIAFLQAFLGQLAQEIGSGPAPAVAR
jgi:uncharacterized protein